MYTQHFLLADALAGREEEFAAWYRSTHIPDVLRIRLAAVAGQLFRRSERQLSSERAARFSHGFLGLYEGTDPEAMTGTYGAPDDTKMQISDAADLSIRLGGGYFDSVIQHTKTPAEWPDGFLITEWLEPAAATPEAIGWYVQARFPALMRKPPVISGWFGKQSTHQLFEAARPAFAASYKVSDFDGALQDWIEAGGDASSAWFARDVAVICYEPISARMTRLQLLGA